MTAVRSSLALVVAVFLTGCSDLFHSTDWKSLCGDGSCESSSVAGTATGMGGTGSATGGSPTSSMAAGGSSGSGGGGGSGGTCGVIEDCATPGDDDCNGRTNETCAATGYKFDVVTLMDYPDEGHDQATTGDPANVSAFGSYALGQLLDGVKGSNDFGDLGNGPAYEWVVWVAPTVGIVFDFGLPRDFTEIDVGISNVGLYVYEPSEIQIGFGDDGVTFARTGPGFKLSDGSLQQLAEGTRGDVVLPVSGKGRYLRITLVQSTTGGAEALDEVAFK